MTDAELRDVAYHEAAHAVLHVVLGYELEFVSIIPDEKMQSIGQTKGTILPSSVTTERIRTGSPALTVQEEAAVRDNVVNLLAGEVVEGRIHGDPYRLDPVKTENHTRDEQWALGQLQRLYPFDGGYDEADRQLELFTQRAEELVDDYRDYIDRVAEALLKCGRLSASEVKALAP